jgi:hypothetical protein
MEQASGFEVRRDRWRDGRVLDGPVPAVAADGQVVLRIDRFALTSNNVTYAVIGDLLGYWTFFPADDGWGRVPAMGFADVAASSHPDVAIGERVFGFFPMATHLRVDAGDVGAAHFVDVAPHREATALPYRQYLRSTADGFYEAAREDLILLFRGLFLTSFLMEDFLADNGWFDAQTIVISSASSKTAIALAHLLAARPAGRVVGLTSARNADFPRTLGCWTDVVRYDDVATIAAEGRVVFVDHSGDAAVVRAVHERFGDDLVYSGIVGATHWDRRGRTTNLPGAAPAFFFAPSQLEKRTAEWGADGFQSRVGAAWRRFVTFTDGWLNVERGAGPADVQAVWEALVDGRTAPNAGHVVSMWQGAR